jgi:hypothetical protein
VNCLKVPEGLSDHEALFLINVHRCRFFPTQYSIPVARACAADITQFLTCYVLLRCVLLLTAGDVNCLKMPEGLSDHEALFLTDISRQPVASPRL